MNAQIEYHECAYCNGKIDYTLTVDFSNQDRFNYDFARLKMWFSKICDAEAINFFNTVVSQGKKLLYGSCFECKKITIYDINVDCKCGGYRGCSCPTIYKLQFPFKKLQNQKDLSKLFQNGQNAITALQNGSEDYQTLYTYILETHKVIKHSKIAAAILCRCILEALFKILNPSAKDKQNLAEIITEEYKNSDSRFHKKFKSFTDKKPLEAFIETLKNLGNFATHSLSDLYKTKEF